MKMKKYLFKFKGILGIFGSPIGAKSALAPAFLFTLITVSCAKDEAILKTYDSDTIKFRIAGGGIDAEAIDRPYTKAAGITGNIRVVALKGDGTSYLDMISPAGPGIIDTGNPWPPKADTLAFCASTEGIVIAWSGTGDSPTGSFTYQNTRPEDPMVAISKGNVNPGHADTPVQLDFYHALSQVHIKAAANLPAGTEITSFSLMNVMSSGSCEVGANGAGVRFNWHPADADTIAGSALDLYVIPQNTSSIRLGVNYKVDNRPFSEEFKLAVASWAAGYEYSYTFGIERGAIVLNLGVFHGYLSGSGISVSPDGQHCTYEGEDYFSGNS